MSEYYAVQRSTDHLEHYGVKGMKWGVRKALLKGNERALDRNFRRAARKLRKLQDIALKPKKYAAKATAYGIAATGTGTIAIGGASLLSNYLRKKALGKLSTAKNIEVDALGSWNEKSKSFSNKAAQKHAAEADKLYERAKAIDKDWNSKKYTDSYPLVKDENGVWTRSKEPTRTYEKHSKNDKLRMAAGAATLGIAGMSALNAYRASHPQKYREKAVQFKNAMDEAFSGTKYSGRYVAGPRQRKRKKGR